MAIQAALAGAGSGRSVPVNTGTGIWGQQLESVPSYGGMLVHETPHVPMIDVDTYTPQDVHGFPAGGGLPLGAALEAFDEFATDNQRLLQLNLTPGGIHASDITYGPHMGANDYLDVFDRGYDPRTFTPGSQDLTPRFLEQLLGLPPAGSPQTILDMSDRGYVNYARDIDAWRRRAGPKGMRGDADFVSEPFMFMGPGAPSPSRTDILRDYQTIVEAARSPRSREGLQEVAGYHELHGGLDVRQKALMRALYALGLGGAAVAGNDETETY